MAKVSVIIATRNRCALLPRAVESARRASGDVEVIVVDDASTDRTRAVCEAWNDVRYIGVRHRRGVSGARNMGILASTSEYISFLDDDDARLPGSLDVQLQLLEAHKNAGMIYGRALYGDDDCRPGGDFYPDLCLSGDIFRELLRWNFVPCPSVIFRKACLSRVGLLDEDAAGLEDWDLWVRIAELYTVLAIEQPVAIWRRSTLTSKQFTSHPEKMHRVASRLHREKWLRLPRALELSVAERRKIADAYADCATNQLASEVVSRLKSNHLQSAAVIIWTIFDVYRLALVGKVFRAATWRIVAAALRKRLRKFARHSSVRNP